MYSYILRMQESDYRRPLPPSSYILTICQVPQIIEHPYLKQNYAEQVT